MIPYVYASVYLQAFWFLAQLCLSVGVAWCGHLTGRPLESSVDDRGAKGRWS